MPLLKVIFAEKNSLNLTDVSMQIRLKELLKDVLKPKTRSMDVLTEWLRDVLMPKTPVDGRVDAEAPVDGRVDAEAPPDGRVDALFRL